MTFTVDIRAQLPADLELQNDSSRQCLAPPGQAWPGGSGATPKGCRLIQDGDVNYYTFPWFFQQRASPGIEPNTLRSRAQKNQLYYQRLAKELYPGRPTIVDGRCGSSRAWSLTPCGRGFVPRAILKICTDSADILQPGRHSVPFQAQKSGFENPESQPVDFNMISI